MFIIHVHSTFVLRVGKLPTMSSSSRLSWRPTLIGDEGVVARVVEPNTHLMVLESLGMCVSWKHEMVVVSEYNYHNLAACQLHVYSLRDGRSVRTIGRFGTGKEEFNFTHGGLCVSPDGDCVLLAEDVNRRIHQLSILDGSWVRFIGDEGVLTEPRHVDANWNVVVVSETCQHVITVLSWVHGHKLAQFGGKGCEQGLLSFPRGVRLLADNAGIVVADSSNRRVCVFSLEGTFVKSLGDAGMFICPMDVLECSDGAFMVGCASAYRPLVTISHEGVSDVFAAGLRHEPWVCALATLPSGGFVVHSQYGSQSLVFGAP